MRGGPHVSSEARLCTPGVSCSGLGRTGGQQLVPPPRCSGAVPRSRNNILLRGRSPEHSEHIGRRTRARNRNNILQVLPDHAWNTLSTRWEGGFCSGRKVKTYEIGLWTCSQKHRFDGTPKLAFCMVRVLLVLSEIRSQMGWDKECSSAYQLQCAILVFLGVWVDSDNGRAKRRSHALAK